VLAREELRDLLVNRHHRDARRAARRVAMSPTQSRATRAKAVVTAIAPGLVGRSLRTREADSFVSVGDRRLRRT
jgi:hypothetical protein